ncbi:MAG: septal ring lytic transglycosylase RlpA family protein [Pseudomonadota bacterium]
MAVFVCSTIFTNVTNNAAVAEQSSGAPIAIVGSTAKTTGLSASRPVSGEVFQPTVRAAYDREGLATLISADLAGKPTANGETYSPAALSAAHSSLPLPSLVHIVNVQTGQETVVRVNDRGPIAGGGMIELSDRAASVIGLTSSAEGRVRVRYLGPAPAIDESIERPAVEALRTPKPSESGPMIQTNFDIQNVETENAFFVQLGSFSDIANAESLYRTASKEAAVKVVPATIRGSDFFRVVAGPFGDHSAASRERERLANTGVANGIVIRGEN